MSVVDTAKTAYDLAKKGMTVEFQEKIMQLRTSRGHVLN